MQEHLKLLGFKVQDVVTGFLGIVTSISFDLYGCVQAVVQPEANEKGEIGEARWFDVKRLVPRTGRTGPVMAVSSFDASPWRASAAVLSSEANQVNNRTAEAGGFPPHAATEKRGEH